MGESRPFSSCLFAATLAVAGMGACSQGQASFIMASEAEEILSRTSSSISGGGTSEEPAELPPAPAFPDEDQQVWDWLSAISGANGMHADSPSLPTGTIVAHLDRGIRLIPGDLVRWLNFVPECFSPRMMVAEIFRPPRA